MNDYSSKVSLVIPTINRLSFVKKLINYYILINFKGPIHIGDSSQKEEYLKLKNYVNVNKKKLNVSCYWMQNMPEGATTKNLLNYVSTPYVLWSGDDDYFLKDGINKCVKFLENNHNYIAANGFTYILEIKTNPFKIFHIRKYSMYSFNFSSARQRLDYWLNNTHGDIFYSMHRTENMRNNYQFSDIIEHHIFSTGDSPSIMSVLQGNIKNIQSYFLLRTIHEMHFNRKRNFNINKWKKAFIGVKNSLIQELSTIDNISLIEASDTFDNIFDVKYKRVINKNKLQSKKEIITKGKNTKNYLITRIIKYIIVSSIFYCKIYLLNNYINLIKSAYKGRGTN